MDFEDNVLYTDSGEEIHTFKCNSDAAGEWCLKKIKAAQEEHDRLMKLIAEERADLDRKAEEIEKRLESDTRYFKSQLFAYFQTVEKKETKTQQSYKLLSGSLVYKKPSQKMVPNKEKLLDYCKTNNMPEFVKVKEDFDWATYKKECEIVDGHVVNVQTGDLLPEDLITIEDDPGKFEVK